MNLVNSHDMQSAIKILKNEISTDVMPQLFNSAWYNCKQMHVKQQGKSERFESCDRPIVRKRPIWVKITDVLSRVTLKFDG